MSSPALMPQISTDAHQCLQDRAVGQLLGHTRFTSPEDTLILEDESARMPLTGDALSPGSFVTGVVMAVRGTAVPGAEGFHVQVWSPAI